MENKCLDGKMGNKIGSLQEFYKKKLNTSFAPNR